MSKRRFYHHPLLQAYFRVFGLFGFVNFVLIAAAKIPAELRVASLVFASLWLYVTWVRLGRRGVEARFDGIYVRRLWRTGFISWVDITNFRIARPGMSRTVCADLVSGRMALLPLTQGRRASWSEGTSRDMVTVLNDELAAAHKRGPGLRAGGPGEAAHR